MGYSDSGTAIAFIVIGSLIAAGLTLSLLCYFLRLWIRGPTLGSDNKRRLHGCTIAITGDTLSHIKLQDDNTRHIVQVQGLGMDTE